LFSSAANHRHFPGWFVNRRFEQSYEQIFESNIVSIEKQLGGAMPTNEVSAVEPTDEIQQQVI